MKNVGLVTDIHLNPAGLKYTNAYPQTRRRIYTDEVPMATDDDLRIIDDRIFLRELELM